MKCAIATLYLPNYQILADLTNNNKMQYCELHGYDFIQNVNPDPSLLGFEKINTILEHLDNYDKIWFTDNDSFVTNFKIKLEDIEDGPIVISKDINGINAGSMIVKNCPEAKQYLLKIKGLQETYRHHHWQEQQAMIDNQEDCLTFVKQKVINSYLYECYNSNFPEGQWEKGDFLLHMPGMNLYDRVRVFKKYEEFIIR